jgi:hypothetical protein
MRNNAASGQPSCPEAAGGELHIDTNIACQRFVRPLVLAEATMKHGEGALGSGQSLVIATPLNERKLNGHHNE